MLLNMCFWVYNIQVELPYSLNFCGERPGTTGKLSDIGIKVVPVYSGL